MVSVGPFCCVDTWWYGVGWGGCVCCWVWLVAVRFGEFLAMFWRGVMGGWGRCWWSGGVCSG